MKDIRNKLITGGILGLVVIITLLIYTDVKSAGLYIQQFPLLFLIPIIGLTLFNYALRWVKWHYYLGLIGVENLSRTDSGAIFVSGFVLALSPGKVAELLKAVILRMMTGMPVARSAPTIIAERITDGLAMLILGAIGFGGILFSDGSQQAVLQPYIPAYLAILGILLAGIIIIQIRPAVLFILKFLEYIPIVKRFSASFHELYESSYELFQPIPLIIAVGLGVISWMGECIGFYLILRGLGLDATWLLLWQSMFMLAAATIIGAVSGLPGGLGAAEFTITGMIQLLVLGYQDPSFAGIATILIRISTLWFGVGLGALTAFIFRKRLFPPQIADLWQETTTK